MYVLKGLGVPNNLPVSLTKLQSAMPKGAVLTTGPGPLAALSNAISSIFGGGTGGVPTDVPAVPSAGTQVTAPTMPGATPVASTPFYKTPIGIIAILGAAFVGYKLYTKRQAKTAS